MAKVSIIAVAYNELKCVQLTFNTWKAFLNADEEEFIIVNNGGTDGLREWAVQNKDIVFINRDKTENWGNVVNSVLDELKIENDIFV